MIGETCNADHMNLPRGDNKIYLDLDNGLQRLSSKHLETAGDTMHDSLMLRRDGHLVPLSSNRQPAKCLINCCDTAKVVSM